MSAGHREDDVGGLGTDTGKGHQLLPRAFGREAENALDPTVPLVPDRGRRRANPRGLLTRKARVPGRPAIASSEVPASRSGVMLPTRRRRSSSPRRSFAAVVLCERIVETRTSKGVIPVVQSFRG